MRIFSYTKATLPEVWLLLITLVSILFESSNTLSLTLINTKVLVKYTC